MKWSLMFKEKMKAAIILVVLMVGIIVSNLLEKRITSKNDFTVSSIFEDRLQPSIYLYEMRTLNEQRQFVLEEYLHASDLEDINRLEDKMQSIHQSFDDLLIKYKATFLVDEEQNMLNELNSSLKSFDSTFVAIDLSQQKEEVVKATKNSIVEINDHLGKLNKLQSKVGRQLLVDYKKDTYYSSFLNTFQILLSVLIGVIILNMVANSRLLNKNDQKINLN
ncbi:MAG TPA: MCP four helix bundle domain-containing protein [Pelobium sp.]|nr:MCP four helix bundle domain-containing protein [Pelobium sp.]